MENENLNTELENTAADEELYGDVFDDTWEDAPEDADEDEEAYAAASGEGSEETAEDESVQEQTETEEAEAETSQEAAGGEEGNQLFTLKHLNEEKQYSLEDIRALAQKGLDYDHIRQDRDSLRQKQQSFDGYEKFLTELAEKSGLSIQEQIDMTRALWLIEEEKKNGKTLSEGDAILRIQRNKAEKITDDASDAEAQEAGDDVIKGDHSVEKRDASFRRFVAEYPDVKAEDIPQEVWTAFGKGEGDLADIYARHENNRLKAEIERLKQEKKNKDRSTGSRRTAGATTPKDIFDETWDMC